MTRIAIVKNEIVVNVIELEPDADYNPGHGFSWVEADENAEMGSRYVYGSFVRRERVRRVPKMAMPTKSNSDLESRIAALEAALAAKG